MQYFTSSLTNSSMSLADNLQLVTKVYFPRMLLPLAGRDRADGRPHRRSARAGRGDVDLRELAERLGGASSPGVYRPRARRRARRWASSSRRSTSAIATCGTSSPCSCRCCRCSRASCTRSSEIPTKWQWVLAFNPMTAVIGGWRWAWSTRPRRNVAQSAVGVGVARRCSSSSGSASSARPSRSSRTRSDGHRDRGRGPLEELPDRRATRPRTARCASR